VSKKTIVKQIYKAHHTYLPSTPKVNKTHHGLYLGNSLIGAVSYRYPHMSEMLGIQGGDIMEVARVCIAVDMPNLASCAFAKSFKRFIREDARPNGIKCVVTFVKDDGYDGTMLRALQDMGWQLNGISEGSQPGNRANAAIHNHDKQRWIFNIQYDYQQAKLDDWQPQTTD
jgi:hypothetical protein